MSQTAEHFASIDNQLSSARAAWETEKRALEQHIMALETELVIRTKLHDEAIESRTRAIQTTAKLLAQFGVVAQVFDDARQMAINAGLYSQSSDAPAVADNKTLIDTIAGATS